MTDLNRRELLASIGGVAAGAALGALVPPQAAEAASFIDAMRDDTTFPRHKDFSIGTGVTFLNCAWSHPLPLAAMRAMRDQVLVRTTPGVTMPESGPRRKLVKEGFAAMINAAPEEISFIPNTCTGENLVVNALGIAELANTGINVVTDALHFDGALIHLQALQKQRGLDLRVVMPKDDRIRIEDLEAAIDARTKLVEISLVSMYNGFQHDLKAVCDLAHAHGALVYADIIQAAGAVPIDVRASGVDFCACAGFKWLMSDFGLGFLYVKQSLLDGIVRPQWGYESVIAANTHFLPGDPQADTFLTWTAGTSAGAHFEVGTPAITALAALSVSIPYLRQLGVERIQAHRVPLLKKLHAEMPKLGYPALTPVESTSPIVTFSVKDGKAVQERFVRARVNVRVAPNYVRFSPSVFNDEHDIERALEALS
jgi:selenocysteine lyase/cysteine desulfurase